MTSTGPLRHPIPIPWGVLALLVLLGGAAQTAGDPGSVLSVFGRRADTVDAASLETASALALFGRSSLELSGSAPAVPITVRASALFGRVDVVVPRDWQVVVRGAGLAGGYRDDTGFPGGFSASPRPRVLVEGVALFGQVRVRRS